MHVIHGYFQDPINRCRYVKHSITSGFSFIREAFPKFVIPGNSQILRILFKFTTNIMVLDFVNFDWLAGNTAW